MSGTRKIVPIIDICFPFRLSVKRVVREGR